MARKRLDPKPFTPLIRRPRGEVVLVRPGISLVLYCVGPIQKLGPQFADLIESFGKTIPPRSLGAYLANSGHDKVLTNTKLNKDLKELRNIPKKYTGHTVRYTESDNIEVGDYSIHLRGTEPDDEMPDVTYFVCLEFPHDIDSTMGVESVAELLARLASLVDVQSGNAGYAFKRAEQNQMDEARSVNALLKRYLGFESGRYQAAWEMRGHTPRANWLNFIDAGIAKQLGGIDKIRAALPDCPVEAIGKGWMIRAAKYPAVGDINRRAPDLGCIPDVARLLKRTRVALERMGEDPEVFDPREWLAAFDERKSTDWNNE